MQEQKVFMKKSCKKVIFKCMIKLHSWYWDGWIVCKISAEKGQKMYTKLSKHLTSHAHTVDVTYKFYKDETLVIVQTQLYLCLYPYPLQNSWNADISNFLLKEIFLLPLVAGKLTCVHIVHSANLNDCIAVRARYIETEYEGGMNFIK